MRKTNMVFSISMILLLLVHSVIGVLTLTGAVAGGLVLSKIISLAFLTVFSVHVVLSTMLTARSVVYIKHSGASYFRENRMFWVRRISGLAILPFILQHFWMFSPEFTEEGILIVPGFDHLNLAVSVLLAVCVIIHAASNIRSLCISMGTGISRILIIIVFVLFLAGLICISMSFVYYFTNREALWAL